MATGAVFSGVIVMSRFRVLPFASLVSTGMVGQGLAAAGINPSLQVDDFCFGDHVPVDQANTCHERG